VSSIKVTKLLYKKITINISCDQQAFSMNWHIVRLFSNQYPHSVSTVVLGSLEKIFIYKEPQFLKNMLTSLF
jgi:hypothetical protein